MSFKQIAYISAALLPLALGACSNMETASYERVPYCCNRTAGTGVSVYASQPAPTNIAPAAGDEGQRVFHEAVQK
jgi:hypothetical protein